MTQPRRQRARPTTSGFQDDSFLVPNELVPLLNLPVFIKDKEGRSVPNYVTEDLLPRLQRIEQFARLLVRMDSPDRFSASEGSKASLPVQQKPMYPAQVALMLDDLYHKAEGAPAEDKDALAALFHCRSLRAGIEVLDDSDLSSARTWFYFGATAALYLGMATARLDSILRFDGDVRIGKARCEQQREFAKHERGPHVEEKRKRDRQILEWESDLLQMPGKTFRTMAARIRKLHERCQDQWRDLHAVAHYHKDKGEMRAAQVWNIGLDRIKQILAQKPSR